jgi:two-component system response regulator GlrR
VRAVPFLYYCLLWWIQITDKASILVVDDSPSMTKTTVAILTAEGYTVYPAFSGAEALKILGDQQVDILLTDIRMPDMNGLELYREVKQTHPELFTIFMTAYAADDIIREGIDMGIKTLLTKPLDIDFLLVLLSAVEGI